jgi:hypothetical protein
LAVRSNKMNGAGIPTDLGGYGVIAGVVVAIGTIIAVVGKYLDERRKVAILPLELRISHLEEQIAKFQASSKQSQACIIDAMLLPAEKHEERQQLLKQACAYLN